MLELGSHFENVKSIKQYADHCRKNSVKSETHGTINNQSGGIAKTRHKTRLLTKDSDKNLVRRMNSSTTIIQKSLKEKGYFEMKKFK